MSNYVNYDNIIDNVGNNNYDNSLEHFIIMDNGSNEIINTNIKNLSDSIYTYKGCNIPLNCKLIILLILSESIYKYSNNFHT